jgi:hypothetical protein
MDRWWMGMWMVRYFNVKPFHRTPLLKNPERLPFPLFHSPPNVSEARPWKPEPHQGASKSHVAMNDAMRSGM